MSDKEDKKKATGEEVDAELELLIQTDPTKGLFDEEVAIRLETFGKNGIVQLMKPCPKLRPIHGSSFSDTLVAPSRTCLKLLSSYLHGWRTGLILVFLSLS